MQMYDADGTGELEVDEFVSVLALAGFGQEEARRIFSEVDKDGGGSVSMEEFEVRGWYRRKSERCRQSIGDKRSPCLFVNTAQLPCNCGSQAWWIESQRQQAHGVRPAVQLTLGAMTANLTAMVSLLVRKEMASSAKLVKQHLEHLETHGIGGSTAADTPLPPYCMKGEYMAVVSVADPCMVHDRQDRPLLPSEL
jgi:hypothetical protein